MSDASTPARNHQGHAWDSRETPPWFRGCSCKKVGNGALGATSGVAPTALFKKKKRRTCTNTHFQKQRLTDPPGSAECGSSGGRPKANAMFQKRGARSVPKRFFANCVRQCATKSWEQKSRFFRTSQKLLRTSPHASPHQAPDLVVAQRLQTVNCDETIAK